MMKDGRDIEFAWFGNCAMGTLWGQDIIRGHVCMSPLVEEGVFPERTPIINVEGACATASMAFHGAGKHILSGQCDVSLAMGVDKFYHSDMATVLAAYMPYMTTLLHDNNAMGSTVDATGRGSRRCLRHPDRRRYTLKRGHTVISAVSSRG